MFLFLLLAHTVCLNVMVEFLILFRIKLVLGRRTNNCYGIKPQVSLLEYSISLLTGGDLHKLI